MSKDEFISMYKNLSKDELLEKLYEFRNDYLEALGILL